MDKSGICRLIQEILKQRWMQVVTDSVVWHQAAARLQLAVRILCIYLNQLLWHATPIIPIDRNPLISKEYFLY